MDHHPEFPGQPSVVMTTDNAYYLDHDFDKNENRYGVPFIDWRCRFGRAEDGTTELSTNTILYGHNGAGRQNFLRRQKLLLKLYIL